MGMSVSAGCYGRLSSNISRRTGEVWMAFPRIPLWPALAGALPAGRDSVSTYLGITVVLSLHAHDIYRFLYACRFSPAERLPTMAGS